jgi:hypothetical protein
MNDNEKHTLLALSREIVSSKRFRNKKEARLLEYLVSSTLDGQIPKETTIALELFQKDSEFNPADDSLVRSSIYSLRKRLEEYYLDEGREEIYRLVIPKGSYRVDLIEKQEEPVKRKRWIRSIPWLLFSAALLFSLGLLFFGPGKKLPPGQQSTQLAEHPAWGTFVENRQAVKIVLGDSYMVEKENLDSTYAYLRDLRINSDGQLRNAISGGRLPEEWIQGNGHSFVGQEMPQVVFQLFSTFRNTNIPLSVSLASDLSAKDLASHNIIYVGGYRSLGILDRMLSKSHYALTDKPSTIIYKGDIQEDPTWEEGGIIDDFGIDKDYVLVSKMKASSDTDILFILSARAFGKTELVDLLTSKKFDQYLPETEDGDYWEMLFLVSGMESSGLSRERIFFDYLKE